MIKHTALFIGTVVGVMYLASVLFAPRAPEPPPQPATLIEWAFP
jgi:hypothetical protein